MFQVQTPAKIILCGEHSVVYGYPALALPMFSLQTTVEIKTAQDHFSIAANDTNEYLTLSDTSHPLVKLALRVFKALNHYPPPAIKLDIHSYIPIASGLGSGASVATALVKAIYLFCAVPFDLAAINEFVYDTEKHYHGTPSGIDNTVIVYEKPVLYIKNHPVETLNIRGRFNFLVADTGDKASTHEAVGDVARLYQADPAGTGKIFEKIGEIVEKARQSLVTPNPTALGTLMTNNHQLLQQLTISSQRLDTLVNSALDAGALGAKLSGGGRGGNMIALVKPENESSVRTALIDAGAMKVYKTILE